MTTSQSPSVGLDLVAVARWIRSLDIGAGDRLDFERIGLGQSNITLDVRDADGRRWILRRPPLGDRLASAHDVVREARIMMGLAATAVPVPIVYALSEAGEVADAPLVLMEHVDGRVVDSMDVAEQMPVAARRGLSDSMIDSLAAIHAVDLTRAGLVTLASHGPYAPRQLKRWSTQWSMSKTRELPAMEELTKTLGSSLPPQRETVLVHGDFHLRNVVSTATTGRVRAVLDWELATLGDPLADLGSMLAYWPEADDAPTGLFAASMLPGFASHAELISTYVAATGRDETPIRYWHALGLWKIAIICEGVLRRTMVEPLNSAGSSAPSPELVQRLVDRAFSVLAGR